MTWMRVFEPFGLGILCQRGGGQTRVPEFSRILSGGRSRAPNWSSEDVLWVKGEGWDEPIYTIVSCRHSAQRAGMRGNNALPFRRRVESVVWSLFRSRHLDHPAGVWIRLGSLRGGNKGQNQP